MKSTELFLNLQEIAINLKGKIKKPLKYGDDFSVLLSNFNYEKFNKLIDSDVSNIAVCEIDDNLLDKLNESVDFFFKDYSDKDFISFYKILMFYLRFIEEIPFHPLGTPFENNKTVFKYDNRYCCSAKEKYYNDKLSMCKICLANFPD